MAGKDGSAAVRLDRLGAWGGVVGPLVFTAAWVVSSLRQDQPAAQIQLSGLAAENARDPQVMIAGFAVLGVCSAGFGAALRRSASLRKSAGPWLVIVSGAATVAAGAFRRDRMLLSGPGFVGESWHNQVHDVVSAIAYAGMLTAPLVLVRRFRANPRWAAVTCPVQVLVLASAATLAVFWSGTAAPWDGILQRAAVSLALAAEALLATRLLLDGRAGVR